MLVLQIYGSREFALDHAVLSVIRLVVVGGKSNSKFLNRLDEIKDK